MRQDYAFDNRYGRGRPSSACTASMSKRVRLRIRPKALRSARKMVTQPDLSVRSVQRIVKIDLGLKPYKKRKLHGLTSAQIEKHLARSSKPLDWHGESNLEHMAFSDEKLFSVEERLNSQNSRIYALAIEDIPEDMRTVQRFQNEKKLMVRCAISKKG